MTTLFPVDLQLYGLAAAAIFLGALAQGSTGLGFGMLAAPVLAFIDPVFVPGPLLFLAVLVSIMIALREYRAIDRAGLAYALAGRIPASFLAGFTVAAIPAALFGTVFALLVLTALGLNLTGWKLAPTPRNLVGAGLLSGYMGTITSVGAPPMALVYQASAGPRVRSTLGAFFVFGALVSLVALAVFGEFGWREIAVSLNLLPALLLGFLASGLVVRILDKGSTRAAILTFCGLSSVALLVKSVV